MEEPGVDGVLLCAVGAPGSPEEVGPFVRGLRGNRPTPEELVEEMRTRYARIGGFSPLGAISERQAEALERRFRAGGDDVPVRYGAVVGTPSIETALDELLAEGSRSITALALTPYYSSWGVGRYFATVRRLLRARRSHHRARFVTHWHLERGLVEAYSEGVRSAQQTLEGTTGKEPMVVFTAHSLPLHLVGPREPYVRHLGETRRAVARRLALRGWSYAYQSVGSSGGPWLGPSADSLVESIPPDSGGVVVAPCGFIADNLEILYDLDIELKELALRRGVPFARAPVPNLHPSLIEGMESAIRAGP